MDKLGLIKLILDGAEAGNKENAAVMPFRVGEKKFIRTITYHMTGQITEINGKWITLKDAAWIADDGRFMNAMRDGILNEVEPIFTEVILNSDSFIDVYPWAFELPRVQK